MRIRSAWVVEYRETKGPTFVATPERRDLPAHGRFWVEPDTGVVLRSEMVVGGTRRMPARVTITVTYRHEPAIGFLVPIEMLERYDNPRHKEGRCRRRPCHVFGVSPVRLAHAAAATERPLDSKPGLSAHEVSTRVTGAAVLVQRTCQWMD